MRGRFVPPLVLTGADTGMRLAVEETFGPLAPLMRFSREEDAIAIANATPFGLASYFFTSDIRRAWRVGEALEFGMVGLNTGTVSMEAAPFGGVKQSGLGREARPTASSSTSSSSPPTTWRPLTVAPLRRPVAGAEPGRPSRSTGPHHGETPR